MFGGKKSLSGPGELDLRLQDCSPVRLRRENRPSLCLASMDQSHRNEHTLRTGFVLRCPDISKIDALTEQNSITTSSLDTIALPFLPIIGLVPGVLDGAIRTVAAIAAQANTISTTFPSVWFVNFPMNSTAEQKETLREYQQDVLDFRSWSSLKWWSLVFERIPKANSSDLQRMQSSEFASIACSDMKALPWFERALGSDIEFVANG